MKKPTDKAPASRPKRRNRKNIVEFQISRWRFYATGLLLLCLPLALVWRIVGLQVLPNEDRGYEFLQEQAIARTVRTEEIPAYRGVITDRHGEPLAVSSPVISLWANPQTFEASNEELARLASVLPESVGELKEKFVRYKNREFMYLQRHMVPDDAERILALGIEGVYAQEEYRRYYPAAEVTAHILGVTDIDHHGQEGIELAYEQYLAGVSGAKTVLKDLKGRVIRDLQQVRSAEPGRDIALSIDLRLQYFAYRELKRAVAEYGAKSASLVMIDTHTGEILAMVNQPSFNPNDRTRLSPGAMRNRALTDQFEPGSTMKPFTVLAALESGQFLPHTMVDTSPGYIRVGEKVLPDPVNYGRIDVTRIITKSSQVGISKIALQLGPEPIYDMYHRLGFGEEIGIGFPGETPGVLVHRRKWAPIELVNLAFGYGVTVNTLHLARAYAVLANHGVRLPVTLLRQDSVPEGERVVSAKFADEVLEMLKTVFERGGTAASAALDSYKIAGKTGTVHKVIDSGYAEDKYFSVFAGVAPAHDPRIAMAVVIDEPAGDKYSGGKVAAPVFSAVAENALRILQVPPPPHEGDKVALAGGKH